MYRRWRRIIQKMFTFELRMRGTAYHIDESLFSTSKHDSFIYYLQLIIRMKLYVVREVAFNSILYLLMMIKIKRLINIEIRNRKNCK